MRTVPLLGTSTIIAVTISLTAASCSSKGEIGSNAKLPPFWRLSNMVVLAIAIIVKICSIKKNFEVLAIFCSYVHQHRDWHCLELHCTVLMKAAKMPPPPPPLPRALRFHKRYLNFLSIPLFAWAGEISSTRINCNLRTIYFWSRKQSRHMQIKVIFKDPTALTLGTPWHKVAEKSLTNSSTIATKSWWIFGLCSGRFGIEI